MYTHLRKDICARHNTPPKWDVPLITLKKSQIRYPQDALEAQSKVNDVPNNIDNLNTQDKQV